MTLPERPPTNTKDYRQWEIGRKGARQNFKRTYFNTNKFPDSVRNLSINPSPT
jgi:hypothetical protein